MPSFSLSPPQKKELQELIQHCYEQKDINVKIETLYKIYSILPKPLQLKMPLLLTDDYIDNLLYRIEKNLLEYSF